MFCVALLVMAIGLVLDDANAAKVCFDAKICIHNGIERCGVDSKGNVRRFLDACDITEFNCIKSTDYVKTGPEKCKDLPPIEDKENDNDQPPEVNKYWCWRASTCRPTKLDRVVCAKDIQLRTRVLKRFINQCTVFKRNCKSGTVGRPIFGFRSLMYRLWNMFHENHFMIGFINVLLLVQNNQPVAATPGKELDTALLVSQYYCHRFRSCKSPAGGPVCGYSQVNQYFVDFPDECVMFKANCDGHGRVVFYIIEKEICDMKKKYEEDHKKEIFEWERVSRVSIIPSPTPPAITQAPPEWTFSQRLKLAVK